ncbi:MerR family transcriptional regulator [Stackebrandtia nassauensis]|uniref:Transcriptional regulator, MerR family n=1 Tax=Stackebrandtia nassauensis (strain DSM 44728 / CIP 108903 / NRRL B-16338 / NBRC 102104 / LLR-40K-21) TaxID=446470 RepID=D3PUJ9_STANL|nr:MerR family transcriptional regulator [Stackebrandtia nassauensis]ADD43012.1 transcriptional regulator, MerR family [Stackebrandtia nassauensis DSM 44728]
MSWSTRELAELAGTSLRAVRHYHEVGLLEEPERRTNGYKQYSVRHLVRLLRIKRLVDLGFTLSQIADMADTDTHPEEALRTLDAELATTIERLQRARAELRFILRHSAPADLPPELTPISGHTLSEADRSFVTVMNQTLGPQGRQAYSDMVRSVADDPIAHEFDNLPADADEPTRQDLAERLTPYLRGVYKAHPGLRTITADAPRGPDFATRMTGKALVELYNPAQVDVLARVAPHIADSA